MTKKEQIMSKTSIYRAPCLLYDLIIFTSFFCPREYCLIHIETFSNMFFN